MVWEPALQVIGGQSVSLTGSKLHILSSFICGIPKSYVHGLRFSSDRVATETLAFTELEVLRRY